MHAYANGHFVIVDCIAFDDVAYYAVDGPTGSQPSGQTGRPNHPERPRGHRGDDRPERNRPADRNPTGYQPEDAEGARAVDEARAEQARKLDSLENALKDGVITDRERERFADLGQTVSDFVHGQEGALHDRLGGTIVTAWGADSGDADGDGRYDDLPVTIGQLVDPEKGLANRGAVEDYLQRLEDGDVDATKPDSEYGRRLLELAGSDDIGDIQAQIDRYEQQLGTIGEGSYFGDEGSGPIADRIAELKQQLTSRTGAEEDIIKVMSGKRDLLADLRVDRREYANMNEELKSITADAIERFNQASGNRDDSGWGGFNDEDDLQLSYDNLMHYMDASGHGEADWSLERYDQWVDQQDDPEAKQALTELRDWYEAYWTAGGGGGLQERIAHIDGEAAKITNSLIDDGSVLSSATQEKYAELLKSIGELVTTEGFEGANPVSVPGATSDANADRPKGEAGWSPTGETPHYWGSLTKDARSQVAETFWRGVFPTDGSDPVYQRKDGDPILHQEWWINHNFEELNGGGLQFDQLTSDAQKAYLQLAADAGYDGKDAQGYVEDHFGELYQSWLQNDFGRTREQLQSAVDEAAKSNVKLLNAAVEELKAYPAQHKYGKPFTPQTIQQIEDAATMIQQQAKTAGSDAKDALDLSTASAWTIRHEARTALREVRDYLSPELLNALGWGPDAEKTWSHWQDRLGKPEDDPIADTQL